MKKISFVTPCYNEQDNVQELYERIKKAMEGLDYEYEHIFIDNASVDRTVVLLRELAAQDKRVKVILNTRNFGHIRSPYHGVYPEMGAGV
jgi:glycosyltransferase involved in cell wall biosynthesis